MGEKRCSKCGDVKPVGEFAKGRAQCKGCRKKHNQEYNKTHSVQTRAQRRRYYYQHQEECQARSLACHHANAEKNNIRRREHYQTHLEQEKLSRRRWCIEKRAEIKAHKREYYLAHIPEHKNLSRQHYLSHVEQYKAWSRQRYAKQLSVDEHFTLAQRDFVRTFWGNRCAICDEPQKVGGRQMPIDHWNPLSDGHPLTMNNAVLLCGSCNAWKKDHYPAAVLDAVTLDEIEVKIQRQAEAWEQCAVGRIA